MRLPLAVPVASTSKTRNRAGGLKLADFGATTDRPYRGQL